MAEFQTTNKLLKQAIAEAEQLRQVAVENAKLSLEESFPSQIKSMLGRKLRAEAEEGEEENDVEQDEAGEEEGEEAPEASAPAAPKEAPATTETAKELPFQDGESSGGEFADTSAVGTADNKEPSADSFDSADDDTSGEDAGESDTDWYEDWTESDFDLDEVIAELEQDIKNLNGDEEEAELEAPVDGAEDTPDADEAYPNQDSVGTEPVKEVPPKTSGIGTESSHEDGEAAVTATDPNKYADASLKMDGAPEAPEAPVAAAPAVATPEAPVDGEEELDLEVLLRELEVEDEKRMQDSEKMASLEKELAEYRKAVGLLRGKLHEINLLNAKLLYTNKIFRKEGLSNGQRVAIVENFDRATTVREVKMVYTVLVETLTSAVKSLKTPKSSKKVVTEGFASKAIPSTAPKSTPTEALVEQTLAKRFQQLAGILAD